MLLLIGFVLLLVLEPPWNAIGFVACVILFTFEIAFFWRRVRGREVQAGSETLIGRRARVVSPCRPRGQVSLDGERWEARCDAGAGTGETVTIVGRDGLVLVVEKSVPDEHFERDDHEP